MKIGILTFHFGINYGGVLQCYGLQQYLESIGHCVEIINFIPPGFRYRSPISEIISRHVSFEKFRYAIKKIQYAGLQKKEFEVFRKKYLKLSCMYDLKKLGEISTDYDAVIVGSDQVWTPSYHACGAYFLSPLVNYSGKRVSYAPCCAINTLIDENVVKLKRSLQKFSHISVRNTETQCFVKRLTGENPPLVVDPVMLWDFDRLIYKKPLIKEKYVLTYILGNEIDGGHQKIVQRIRKKYKDTKIVSIILTENHPKLFSWADKVYWHSSPQEWLNLFYNASFVYTDSFHGVLFSIKFKKQFVAYYAEKLRASRFIDLARRYNLESHIVKSVEDFENKNTIHSTIDYTALAVLFDRDIDLSKKYIERSIA